MRSLPGRLAVLALAGSLLLSPVPARAEGAVFDDASGWVWFTATTEAVVAAGLLSVAFGDVCETWGCGILMMLVAGGGLVLGAVTGLVAGAADASADVPFVTHHLLWGGVTGTLTAAGFSSMTSATDSSSTELMLAAGAATALGGGVYTAVRRDLLLRSEGAAPWAHLMTWGPLAATLVTVLLADRARARPPLMALLAGLACTAVYGVAITMAEASR